MVKNILKLEGLATLLGSIYFYEIINGNWILFILLLFTPDISMIGYLMDKKLGSLTYNLVHNYILGVIVVFLGVMANNNFIVSLGLIFTAHMGLDRVLGFGLKYPTSFKVTHLQKV